MDLLKDIIRRRDKQKEKQIIERNAYHQVSCIVKQYRLDVEFLSLLDRPHSPHVGHLPETPGPRLKATMDCPPFSLTTESEYELTMSIISKIGNPYLQYAHSPDEILLSRPLYRLNGAIPVERLMRFHYETLLNYERTRSRIHQ
jgi:hypothetical protein